MSTCVNPFAAAVALCLLVIPVQGAVAQSVKAFPTAEGFGANAVGGRGGRVLEVTNLNDSGVSVRPIHLPRDGDLGDTPRQVESW